ncbi:hypothetical protein GW17_00049205 [Ensete ventricosum]|nr:hypothetical protein GW17_00049205 [Ensete ventricosum]RZS15083.1 hypothetical protein BHM03_00046872 [Ensete ventricosum]
MSSPRGTKACGGVAADRQIHVLAVDDSSVDRAVIARILRSSKYRGVWRKERRISCSSPSAHRMCLGCAIGCDSSRKRWKGLKEKKWTLGTP